MEYTEISIETRLKEAAEKTEAALKQYFTDGWGGDTVLAEAMQYSLLGGGKLIRAFLVLEFCRLFGGTEEAAMPYACALEMVHAYSLIHDDLPCMDDDDLRRGKPSCHKQFDEATAILAGDGLLTYAFEILSTSPYDDKIKIELIKLLSQAAGAINGMIAGQMLDLSTERMTNITNQEFIIKHIEEMKTGCLLKYACEAGAVIGKADNTKRQALVEYSRRIGIAFQIADDILDVEGSQEIVGKTLKKDKAQNKLTFVGCYGIETARQMSRELIEQAKDIVSVFGKTSQNLQDLADFIINRNY